MTKRSRSLLLLVVMLLQVLLFLVPLNIAERAQAWSHEMQHIQTLLHHHHQDQSLHLEQAKGQTIDHVHIDNSFSSAALVPSAWPTVAIFMSFERWAMAPATIPCPHLEGPLRPPQHLV